MSDTPTVNPEHRTITADYICSALQIHPRTLNRMVDDGRFPAPLVLAHDAKRWRPADLEAFLGGGAK